MKTIVLQSEFSSSVDIYALEVVTRLGLMHCLVLYYSIEAATRMREFYLKNGYKVDGSVWKVYEVNIVHATLDVTLK